MSKKKKNRPAQPSKEEQLQLELRKALGQSEKDEAPKAENSAAPEEKPAAPAETGASTRRFIRTSADANVHIKTSPDAPSNDGDALKYTDRLSPAAPEPPAEPQKPEKPGTYAEAHKTEETGGRMIRPDVSVQLTFDDFDRSEPAGDHADDTRVVQREPADGGEDNTDGGTRPMNRGELLRQIAGTADEDVRRNPDQLMMEGFDTIGMKTEEEVRREEELEAELRNTREKKIGAFRFWGKKANETTGETQDKTLERASLSKALPDFAKKFSARFQDLETPFAPIPGDEYTDHLKRREGFAAIAKSKRATLIKAAILGVLGLILLIINAIAKGGAAKNEGFITIFGGSETVLITLNLVVLLWGVALTLRELRNGVCAILKLHPRADAALFAMDLAVLVQTVLSYFTQKKLQSDFQLLAPAAVLLSAAYLVAEYFYREHTHQCFKSVSTKSDKSYLRTVSDPVLAVRLTGDPEGKKKVVYVGRTRFIHSFFEKSATAAAGASGYGRVIALCCAVAGVTGILAWILGKSFILGVSGAALVLCFSMPVSCLIATGFHLSARNRILSLKSSFIGSFEDAAALTHAENVAADANEVFDVKLKTILTTKGVSEKQARYVAASILNKSDSLLRKAFRADIETFDDKLPPAEDLKYEEKLGLSAWVGGCKVLFGTYDLLSAHSVEVPSVNVIENALGENERAVFLSIEGRFAAVFTVEYRCREELKKGAASLADGGCTILLSTADANITDTFAESLLGLPKESVRVMTRAAAVELAAARTVVTDAEDPGVVFTDGFTGLCRVAEAASMLEKIRTVSSLTAAAGAIVASILGLILVASGAYHGISAFSVLLLQIVFTALCFLSPLLASVEPAISGGMKKLSKGREKAKETDAGKDTPEDADAPEESPADEAAEETPQKAPAEPAPEAPAEPIPAPAEETPVARELPAEEKDEAHEPGDFKEEDFSLFSEVKREKKKKAAKGKKVNAEKDAPAPEAPAAEEAPDKLITSQSMRSAFSAIDNFLDDLTAGETTPEKDRSTEGFTLFGKDGEGRRTAEDIEGDYERRKLEERSVREAFTAPEAPAAPVFDTNEPPEEEPEPDMPDYDDEPVDLFDDDLWSRFEDDKVFAGLHENEQPLPDDGFNF